VNSALRKAILGTPLAALPNLWGAASDVISDAGDVEIARQAYTISMFGNHSQLLQQVVASSDTSIGWAPWQLSGVDAIAGIDPASWALGEIFADAFDAVLGLAEEKLREVGIALLEQLAEAIDVKALVGSVANLVPIAGPVVNIIIGILFAIGDLVKLSKKATAATLAEDTIRPPAPDVGDDELAVTGAGLGALDLLQSGDWTALWLPTSDPRDAEKSWIGSTSSSWGCAKICNQTNSKGVCVSSGGRLLAPLSGAAWKSNRHGFGCVPGMPDVHRMLWQQPSGSPGSGVFDTGAWYPLLRSTAQHAWLLLMADGPSAFAVDPAIVRTAWQRYAADFFQQLDAQNGAPRLCGQAPNGDWMLNAANRTKVRKAMMTVIGSLAQADKPLSGAALEVTMGIMRPTIAMNALEQRQASLLKRTTIAYVAADLAPPALRERIKAAQHALLESSDSVCKIDPSLIKDALFRANVESRQESLGFSCSSANTILSQSVPLGPGDDPVPPPPTQPAGSSGRAPVPGSTRPGTGPGPKARGPARGGGLGSGTPSGSGGGGAALVILGIGAAAILASRKGRR
jgi:hypothetical protein